MRIHTIIAALLISAGTGAYPGVQARALLGSVPSGSQREKPVTKVVEVQHADVNTVTGVLHKMGFAGNVAAEPVSRTITLRGEPDEVAAMETVVRKLDVAPAPAKNLELTAYLLVALDNPRDGTPLPAKLDPVIKQLRATFNYQSYQLLETLIVRNREGKEGSITGVVPSAPDMPLKTFYTFSYRSASLSTDDKGPIVRIDGLSLGARIPLPLESGSAGNKVQYQNTGVQTNVDVREGQMAVVGKANVDGSSNALVIVLAVRVAD